MFDQITTTRTTYSAPIPPPVTLCAWVKNPYYLLPTDAKYLRAEIIDVQKNDVVVCEWDSVNYFTVARADVRLVHTVNAEGETVKVLGSPPC